MISFNNTTAKILSVNPRAEKHGDENVLAGDLKFQIKAHSKILHSFSPMLREFFYQPDNDDQASLDMGEDNLTSLRHPEIPAIPWLYEGEGYKLRLDYGLGGDSDVKLHDVKIGKFSLTPQEGGTVIVGFRAQSQLDADTIGKLCDLIQGEVKIDLVPPTEQEQFALEEKKREQKAALAHHFTGNDQDPEQGSAGGNDDDDPDEVLAPAGMSVD